MTAKFFKKALFVKSYNRINRNIDFSDRARSLGVAPGQVATAPTAPAREMIQDESMTTVKRQLEPVPFTQVTFDDEFWAPRLGEMRVWLQARGG